jgi:hypothetical protein
LSNIADNPKENEKSNPTQVIKKYDKLDKQTYEIMKTESRPAVTNYYVLIKMPDLNQEKVRVFISRFRSEIAIQKSNVYIYDSKSIQPLIDIYPLEGADYLNVADHFIAASVFELPDEMEWYPFQDLLYKEYGGTNWKKEPIK